jgi:hypothetical protein
MGRSLKAADRRSTRAEHHATHRRALAAARRGRSVPNVPMSALAVGTVVDVAISFDDAPTLFKHRPAVVVGVCDRMVRVLPCTTQLRNHPRHVRIIDFVDAGLAAPTDVQLRERSLERTAIVRVLGHLTSRDTQRLGRIFGVLAG